MEAYAPRPVTGRNDLFDRLMPSLPAGLIAEFGVFQGGSTIHLAGFGRTVLAFDTFSGLPEADYDKNLDSENEPGKFTADPRAYLREHLNVITVKGRFSDTLPFFVGGVRLAFAYIDCDYFKSYLDVLSFVESALLPGGCFVADDYSVIGARKALDEWLGSHPDWTADRNRVVFARKCDFPALPS